MAILATMTTTAQNTVDVYAAGYERDADDNRIIKVWKNGIELYTLATSKYVDVRDIFVTGNDVYVAGNVYISRGNKNNYIAKVWKNGTELYSYDNGTNDSYFNSIYVSGTDVYVAGYEFTPNLSRIGWVRKNNEILYNLTQNNNNPSVNDMCVSGNDIYVCGQAKNSYGTERATVWKNGNVLYSCGPTYQTSASGAYAIGVLDNAVYISGFSGSTGSTVIYNNTGSIIQEYSSTHRINGFAYANSIEVKGNNFLPFIYAVVTSSVDKVYRNATELYSFDKAKITDISVKNDDVYLTGYDSTVAKIWKNGEELYTLTNGIYDASASSIFVVEKSQTGVNDIQKSSNIEIYPNPANDFIVINGLQNQETLYFFDINGRSVFSYLATKEIEKISIRHLPAGVYFVQIEGSKMLKFVKE